jgi:hypothetical protein
MCLSFWNERAATYQWCKVIVWERMEVILVQRIRNFVRRAVRASDCCRRSSERSWHGTFIVRWIDCPIPKREPYSASDLKRPVAGFASRIFIGNVNSAIVHYLLEECEVRAVPGTKQATGVRAIAHHRLTDWTSNTVPLPEWYTVYS